MSILRSVKWKYKGNFYKKNSLSQINKNCLSFMARNGKKIRRETVVFGGSGG